MIVICKDRVIIVRIYLYIYISFSLSLYIYIYTYTKSYIYIYIYIEIEAQIEFRNEILESQKIINHRNEFDRLQGAKKTDRIR